MSTVTEIFLRVKNELMSEQVNGNQYSEPMRCWVTLTDLIWLNPHHGLCDGRAIAIPSVKTRKPGSSGYCVTFPQPYNL